MQDKVMRQMDINDLLLSIESKIPRLAYKGFKINNQLEKLYAVFLNGLKMTIAKNDLSPAATTALVDDFHYMIVPLHIIQHSHLYDAKSYDKVWFDLRLQQLNRTVNGLNPYTAIRKQLYIKKLLKHSLML